MLSRANHFARSFGFETSVLLLVALALPRSTLPSGAALACTGVSWLAFSISLLPVAGPAQRLWQLAAGAALAALAVCAPPLWLAVSSCLICIALLALGNATRRQCALSLGVGVVAPSALYAVLFAWGSDERVALRLAFRVDSSPARLAAQALSLLLVIGLTLLLLRRWEAAPERLLRPLSLVLGSLVLFVLSARLLCLVTVLTLPSDLLIWSEAPALTNLLKLQDGEPFYGPLAWVNSYSYSPALELTQYGLLRPFQLELSLRAHRGLGLFWQLCSAVVLSRALWPWLETRLNAVPGRLGYPLLLSALANVTLSSLLAPHVHPDHLLMLCFSAALALCLQPAPFTKRIWWVLALLPVVATLFKLTGAGIGFGLVLAVCFERRWSALGALTVGGALALSTVPLCDATLGQFSTYAIRMQASHPVLWSHLLWVPGSPPGLIFIVALLARALAALKRDAAAMAPGNVRAATRCLLLTVGFGLPSLVAYCKLGGRDNSLLPLAIGGAAALFALFGATPRAKHEPSEVEPQLRLATPLVLVLFWAVLSTSWPIEPLFGATRSQLLSAHAREVSWLRSMFARGKRPLSQGVAAWIEIGRRDVPRDRLASASELDLAHWPNGFEASLFDGTYDGLCFTASAWRESPLLVRLRARLESQYRLVEPAGLGGVWPTGDRGYVILERR